MSFTFKGITRTGEIFYSKTWNKRPSSKILRMLRDRYDNRYGAYLTWKIEENQNEN